MLFSCARMSPFILQNHHALYTHANKEMEKKKEREDITLSRVLTKGDIRRYLKMFENVQRCPTIFENVRRLFDNV